jgi:glutaredoxin
LAALAASLKQNAILMFGTPSCGGCKTAVGLLGQAGVKYHKVNIATERTLSPVISFLQNNVLSSTKVNFDVILTLHSFCTVIWYFRWKSSF